MRPRGESISSFQRTYVGQTGKQKPQWTQVSIICLDGGWCASKVLANGVASGRVVMKDRCLLSLVKITEGQCCRQTPKNPGRNHFAGKDEAWRSSSMSFRIVATRDSTTAWPFSRVARVGSPQAPVGE